MDHQSLIKIGQYFRKSHQGYNIKGEEIEFFDGFIPSEKEMADALLAIKKSEATAKIDEEFEAKRQSYLTSGATMSMVYKLKSEQAKAYKANPNGTYKMLQASVTAGEAATLEDAADFILGKESQLIAIASQLETERLSRKIAVENAVTIEEIENA